MANQTTVQVCTICCSQFDKSCRRWQCTHNLPRVSHLQADHNSLVCYYYCDTFCDDCVRPVIQGQLDEFPTDFGDEINTLICACGKALTLADCGDLQMNFTKHDALMTERKRVMELNETTTEMWKRRAMEYDGTGSRDHRPCPKCGIDIRKIEGCQYMTCTKTNCKTGFDWRDGEVYDQAVGRTNHFKGEWVAYWKN